MKTPNGKKGSQINKHTLEKHQKCYTSIKQKDPHQGKKVSLFSPLLDGKKLDFIPHLVLKI